MTTVCALHPPDGDIRHFTLLPPMMALCSPVTWRTDPGAEVLDILIFSPSWQRLMRSRSHCSGSNEAKILTSQWSAVQGISYSSATPGRGHGVPGISSIIKTFYNKTDCDMTRFSAELRGFKSYVHCFLCAYLLKTNEVFWKSALALLAVKGIECSYVKPRFHWLIPVWWLSRLFVPQEIICMSPEVI